jgi:hypothetical protein
MLEAMNSIDAAAPRPKQTMSELKDMMNGPQAWSGGDFKDEETYTLKLDKKGLQEVDAALQSFKSKRHTGKKASLTPTSEHH